MGALIVDNMFRGMARAGRLHPLSRPERHNVEILRDIPYRTGTSPALHLDVYRPTSASGPLPVILYIHGGGFRILSKDSHWVMGLAFARRGFVVFNISYRLAPRHPFPAGLADAAAAYGWVLDHAARYGGDASRLVLAGESAGANLVTALTIAACQRRDEPWARALYDRGHVPRATMPACGILQVSDPDRFLRGERPVSWFIHDRFIEVYDAYLGASYRDGDPAFELADPLCLLEGDRALDRPLPPFFAPCGTADPLLADTRRLAAALARRGVDCEAREYQGELHAFHALVFRPNARRCWRDTYAFLDRVL
jgi:acetyl esterase/lipase